MTNKEIEEYKKFKIGHLEQVLQMIESYYVTLFSAYHRLLCLETDTNNFATQSDEYETWLSIAFENRYKIMPPEGFITYVQNLIFENIDTDKLALVYNIISRKLNSINIFTANREDFNPSYPVSNSLIYDTLHDDAILFYSEIIKEVKFNVDEYIEDYDNCYFTADDLFDAIVKDLERTKQMVNSLFSIKKLNEINPKQTQPNNILLSKTSIHSFTLINNNNNNKQALESVLNTLKSNNFISDNNTLPQFKKVFSGEAVTKKVSWIGNVNELHWFVKWLVYGIDEIKPKIKTMPKQIWQVSFLCFEVKNKKGEIVTAKNLSSNNSDVSLEKKVLLIKAINHLQ